MKMKICGKCEIEKGLSKFSKDKSKKDRLRSICKSCVSNYYQANKVAIDAKRAERYQANKVKVAAQQAEWRQANPDKANAYGAKYRATKLEATMTWDQEDIKQMYSFAKMMEKTFGGKHHVDHIVPLVHDKVCGLHVADNLQVLEASVNMSKSNKWEQ